MNQLGCIGSGNKLQPLQLRREKGEGRKCAWGEGGGGRGRGGYRSAPRGGAPELDLFKI